MSSIVPVQPITPLPQASVQTPAPPEARLQDLRPEQIVRATVAEGGREEVLLEFAGRQVRAETQVPLRAGQKIDVQILSTSPRLELRLLEDTLGERLNRGFHLLGGKWELLPPIRELLEGPSPLFERLSPSARIGLEVWLAVQQFAYERPDREFLRHLARRFGLDLEARLARGEGKEGGETLKGALLEVARHAEGETAEKIGRLLQGLELFQLCQARLAQLGLQFLPLPFPWLEQGYLIADQGGEKEPGARRVPFQLSLCLRLEGLGDLRIDFLHELGGFYLRFAGESTEKTEFLASFQDELQEALGERLRGVTFTEGAENPAATLLRRVLSEGTGRLDTRV